MWRTCWGRRQPSKAAVINWLSPFAEGLVASWPFNDGPASGYLKDYTLQHPGTLTNMDPPTDWVPSEMGMALDFDGVNAYIALGSPPATNFSGSFSLVALVYPNDTATRGDTGDPIISKEYSNNGYQLTYQDDDGKFGLLLSSGGFSITWGANGHDLGAWYFVVATYDGTTAKIYVNGVLENSAADAFTNNDTTPLYFMRFQKSGRELKGCLSAIAMYSRALSTEEVAWLYRHPYCMYVEPVHVAWWETAGGGIHELAGTMQAELIATGTLTRMRQLAGSLVAELTAAGSLSRQRQLAAVMVAELTGTGTPTRVRALAGEILIELVGQGELSRARALAGTLAAELTGSGTLRRGRALHGELLAELTGTGALTRERQLVGEMVAELILTGSLGGFGIEVIPPLHLAMLERHGIHLEDLRRIRADLRQIGRSGIHGKC